MKKSSAIILRIGLGITFIYIGIMIYQEPQVWGSYLQPWALDLLPFPLIQTMKTTAILDILFGILFLFRRTVWYAALYGTVHMTQILITSGINEGTVRDIGLMGGSLALFVEHLPQKIAKNLFK